MLFRQFYDRGLAQASYLIGCSETGEAIVVDPNRDLETYLDAARTEKLRIAYVTETHIHADFLSGSRELARVAGAELLLSGEGGDDWSYRFADASGARLLHAGDSFMVGNIRFDVRHTPGHTPEHLVFLVTDTAATEQPIGLLSGDFIFVGDVGRPDLLERAAGIEGTMEAAARQLYHSLQQTADLPDFLQIWPGHGAGSSCGKALGAVPQSTLGYERMVNWAFGVGSEATFVTSVLEGQPSPPPYFAVMKRLNRDGPPYLSAAPAAARMDPAALDGLLDAGTVVLDVRPAEAFGKGHIPRTINIPLSKSFTKWAGWMLPHDADIYLIAPDEEVFRRALNELRLIGIDRVAGWFDESVFAELEGRGHSLQTIAEIAPDELARRMQAGGVTVVDVRERSEYRAGHLAGVPNIPLGELRDRVGELPTGRPLVLHCQGGGRASIGAALLQAEGIADVVNLTGGFGAWEKDGQEVEVDAAETVEA